MCLLKAAWMTLAKICDISALHTSVSAMGLTALFFSLPALELLKFFWSGRVSCHVSACTAAEPQSCLEVPQYPCLVKGSCKVCLSRSVPLFFSNLPLCVASNRTQKTLLSLGTSVSFPACCKEMKTEVFFVKYLYAE